VNVNINLKIDASKTDKKQLRKLKKILDLLTLATREARMTVFKPSKSG